MAVQVPTAEQLREVAADDRARTLTDADIKSFIGLLGPTVAAYNVVDSMADNLPAVRYPRTPGYRPIGDENKYNAWYVKTTVHGAAEGKLKGKTIVLKDNIMLAGVPMMNGAATLEGYIPEIDATVVQRISGCRRHDYRQSPLRESSVFQGAVTPMRQVRCITRTR